MLHRKLLRRPDRAARVDWNTRGRRQPHPPLFKAVLTVDELHLFVAPIVVGAGKQSLPDHVRLELELLAERRFASGMVHLRYRTRT